MFFHRFPFPWRNVPEGSETKKTGRKAQLLPARFERTGPLRFFCLRGVPFLEAFNASSAVDKLLLSGVKWMALVADIDVRALYRGTRLDHIAA
jgi:hypothetical protein